LDSGSQEAGLVQDKHSYNENKQTYERESVTENDTGWYTVGFTGRDTRAVTVDRQTMHFLSLL